MQLQELEMELGEHELVVKQLTPLDGGRRAFRLANGVLMERTVGEVLPELTNTAENVRAVRDWVVDMLVWGGVADLCVAFTTRIHSYTTQHS